MTQEEKQLLLSDLCGRLRYGVMVHAAIDGDNTLLGIYNDRVFTACEEPDKHNDYPVECIKPYLRPMSSITEEEENEWCVYNIDPLLEAVGKPHTRVEDLMLRAKSQYVPLDWLNEHHLDYHGLIPMGLALEAPEGMYKTK